MKSRDRRLYLTANQFLAGIEKNPTWDTAKKHRLKQAVAFGQRVHRHQKRVNGDNYFEGHCLPVGAHLNSLNVGANLVIAGILHDCLEDTRVAPNSLEINFGADVRFLVESVTKLKTIKYRYYDRHLASLRQFFIASAKDVRVVILKLCDRLHNLETLQYLPPEKQKRIADESLLIHGRLAARLNMGELSQQINDAAFAFAQEEAYKRTVGIKKQALGSGRKVIESIYRDCASQLTSELGYTPVIDRRIKGTYSLYRKLVDRDWDIDRVIDLVAIRIIVNDEKDCYSVLGWVHQRWRPVPNHLKDYIATPKPNGYQSLHTTIFSGQGGLVEIQIKTAKMHHLAEYGVSSHYFYKHRDESRGPKGEFNWLDQLGELNLSSHPSQYLKELKTDFFSDRIFVFTPRGDVIDLPVAATGLDFAFAVHTDLGLTAKGVKINNVYKALKTPLKSGDVIEVVTAKTSRPTRTWIDWATTNVARAKIRNYLRKQTLS